MISLLLLVGQLIRWNFNMSNESNEIIINQTLHGYSDGHSLLATSKKLPSDVDRVMLTLSDMSGPSIVKGFNSYITGYPLKSANLYALSKTWYASEMKRPGCVWTHTLIIQDTDFYKISEPKNLLTLFRKPTLKRTWSEYETTLNVPAENNKSNFIIDDLSETEISESTIEYILMSLYSFPEKPVFLPADNSNVYEHLILEFWNAQWPNLQCSFSFCTGSIYSRKLNGNVFDFQVIPINSLEQVKRDNKSGIFLQINKLNEKTNLPNWVSVAFEVFFNKRDEMFLQFMRKYTEDIKPNRTTFPKIIELYKRIEDTDNQFNPLAILTKTLYELFPKVKEASLLKASIYGSTRKNSKRLLNSFSEHDLLGELCTTKFYDMFDEDKLNIDKRAKNIYSLSYDSTQDLILKILESDLNPIGEMFLLSVSEEIGVEDLISLSYLKPGIINLFLQYNPRLALQSIIWGSQNIEPGEILSAIASSGNLTKEIKDDTIKLLLELHKDDVANILIDNFGTESIYRILDWYDLIEWSSEETLGYNWKSAMKRHPAQLLNWLKDSKDANILTVDLIANLLNPNSIEVIQYGSEIWRKYLNKIHISLSEEAQIKVMAFMLTFAFNNPKPDASSLVAEAFQTVHDAVARNQLKYNNWIYLNQILPELPFYINWDKCERLRRTLADKFIEYDWPIEHFLQAVKDNETLHKIARNCSNSSDGINFLKRVLKEAPWDGPLYSDKQRRILIKYTN